MKKLKEVPEGTLFTLDRYESNYAVCENRTTGEMIDIPKSLVNSYAKEGDILKFENDKFQIDFEESIKQREVIENLIEKTSNIKKNNI